MSTCRYHIEPVRAGDIPEVAAIDRLSHPGPGQALDVSGELLRDWARVDVARVKEGEHAGRVVAYSDYWLVHDEVHLLGLATHPGWRRRGIATRLMEHLLAFARQHTCRCVTLEVRRSNLPAQALYAAHGFAIVGARPRYYADNDEDALIMTRDLGDIGC